LKVQENAGMPARGKKLNRAQCKRGPGKGKTAAEKYRIIKPQ
jgi:hypothetical protein